MSFSLRSFLASFAPACTKRRKVAQSAINVERMEARALLSAANFGFAASFEGGAAQNVNDVVTDSSGNVYSVGGFAGTTDFDPGPSTFALTSQGPTLETDGFISKLDKDGNFVAAGQFAGNKDVEITGIDVDPSGNLYVTGNFNGQTDFDPGAGVTLVNGGPGDVFVAKLDGSLNLEWAKRIGGGGKIIANDIAVDASGRSYVGGWFSNTIDFKPGGGQNKLTSAGKRDGYVLKFDTDGNAKFVSRFRGNGSNQSEVAALASDNRGNTVATGSFTGTVDFDPKTGITNVASAGGKDTFVTRLDRSGKLTWIRQTGGVNRDQGHAIAMHKSTRDVYVATSHVGTVDLNPGPETENHSTTSGNTSTGHEHFITRFDGSGTHIWTNQFAENAGNLALTDLSVDANGKLYATGAMSGQIDFDSNANVARFAATSGQDVFAAKYDSDGEFIWAALADSEFAHGIAVGESGAVHVVGYGSGGDFDPGNDTASTNPGGFVWQLTQSLEYEVPSHVTNIVIRRNGAIFEIYDSDGAVVLASGDISTTAGIVLDGTNTASLNVTVDYGFGGSFDLPAGIDLQSSPGLSDNLSVIGGANLGVEYRPVTTIVGSSRIIVDAATDVTFTNVEQIDVSALKSATLRTSGLSDTLNASAKPDLGGDYSMTFNGTVGQTQIVPLRLHDVLSLNVETNGGNDTVKFNQNSLRTRGLRDLSVDGSSGRDTMIIIGGELNLDVAGGDINFHAGAGPDTLDVRADTDFEMNTKRLNSASGGSVFFDDLEIGEITGGSSDNLIEGRLFDGDLLLHGGDGNDTLIGGLGNDTINAGSGNDIVRGREGSDALRGGSGDDSIWGHNGHDLIGGGNDDDMIYGQSGSDTLMGGNGADQLDGGADNDALRGDGGADMFMIDADEQANQLAVTLITTNIVKVQQSANSAQSERDTIEQDAADELFIDLLAGNDVINVAANVTLDGTVDGGLGSDLCSAPESWKSINC